MLKLKYMTFWFQKKKNLVTLPVEMHEQQPLNITNVTES